MARKKETGLLYPTNSHELQDALLNLNNTFRKQESRKNDYATTMSVSRSGWNLDDTFALESVLHELNQRKSEALALIEPVPGMVDFFKSDSGEIGVIGSNRSGKTLGVGIKVAKIVTGQWHIEGQFPKQDGVWAIVGPKLKHLRLMFYTLFKPGQFKVLRTANGWKVPKYTDPEDVARIKEWEPGPPLIPKRMVESISFEDVKEEIPSSVKLTNGWVINFFSFESDPVQGVAWNGCLAGDSVVYDPVAMKSRRIDETKESFHVNSFNTKTNKVEVKKASKPFVKGYGLQMKARLSNGKIINVSSSHQVLSSSGEWMTIVEAFDRKESLLQAFVQECTSPSISSERLPEKFQSHLQSERNSWFHKVSESQMLTVIEDDEHLNPEDYGQLRVHSEKTKAEDSQFGYHPSHHSGGAQSRLCEDTFQFSPQQQAYAPAHTHDCSDQGEMGSKSICTLTYHAKVSCLEKTLAYCQASCEDIQQHQELVQQSAAMPQEQSIFPEQSSSCLRTYRSRQQDQDSSFSTPRQGEVESQLPSSIETRTCGYDQVCALSTQQTFSQQHTMPEASHYQGSECNEMSHPSCDSASSNSDPVHVVELNKVGYDLIWDISVDDNHNYIYGGIVNHNCWFDEEHPRARYWLSETRARLMSRKGYFIWSATPENATPTFYALQSRANRPDMKDKAPYKRTSFFKISSKDNPYLDVESREALTERLTEDDPDAAVAKIDGDWAFRKYLVYPEFDKNKHIIEPFEIDWKDTVYVVLDPSRTRCAMMLCALVHPDSPHFVPDQPDRIVVFDEILIKNCTAFKAARALHDKINLQHKHWIEYIIIDWQQGRKKDESEREIAEYYWEEFTDIGIKPRVSHFVHGSANVEGGIETVAQHLDPKNGKPPKFVIMEGKCPYTVWEFDRYYRIKNPDGTPGKPHQRLNDLVDCARYACSAGLTWVMPPVIAPHSSHYSADELRAIDRNPRLWHYTAMFGDPKQRPKRRLA